MLSSFADNSYEEYFGTYGVSATDQSQIKLTINADHTFYYQDFSNPNKKIIAVGKWTLKGKKVVLTDTDSNKNFHNVWSFVKQGQIAKSRKGLTFYRLYKIDA